MLMSAPHDSVIHLFGCACWFCLERRFPRLGGRWVFRQGKGEREARGVTVVVAIFVSFCFAVLPY